MMKWEYKAVNLRSVMGHKTEEEFNALGAEGWEFVGISGHHAIFKRPA